MSLGATTIAMPRPRIEGHDGHRREWHSQIIFADTSTRQRGHWPRCCAAHRCRRTRSRIWRGGCGKTSRLGRSAISASCGSVTSSSMVSACRDREKALTGPSVGLAGSALRGFGLADPRFHQLDNDAKAFVGSAAKCHIADRPCLHRVRVQAQSSSDEASLPFGPANLALKRSL